MGTRSLVFVVTAGLAACAGRVEADRQCGDTSDAAPAAPATTGSCTFATETGGARGVADARKFVDPQLRAQLEVRCWTNDDYLVLWPATDALGVQSGTLTFARGPATQQVQCAVTLTSVPGLGGDRAKGAFDCAPISLGGPSFRPSGEFDAVFGP